MTHTTIKRSVAVEVIDSLKGVVKDWRIYQEEHLFGDRHATSRIVIDGIIDDCEALMAALEGDTITIEP